MCRKSVYVVAIVFLFSFATPTNAVVYNDDFNTPHDYLSRGVPGTMWDGIFGIEVHNLALDANMTNTPSPNDANVGALYIQSSDSSFEYWHEWEEPNFPCLFVEIVGDFNAMVKVVDFCGCWGSPWTAHNSGGICVRVPDIDVSGDGEDAVTIEYFPTWDADTWRNIDDGVETENIIHPEASCAVADWWLRLRRVGNTFYAHCGRPDPDTGNIEWVSASTESVVREDMAESPYLQVGLFNATYSANTAYISFDDFTITCTNAPHPKAYGSYPMDEQINIPPAAVFRWKVADDTKAVGGHKVYYSLNRDQVESRSIDPNIVDDPCFAPPDLQLTKKYYWCVDEVKNDESVEEGDIWIFTMLGGASDPVPEDGLGGISHEIPKLVWTPTPIATSQDFYFGDDEEAVETATVPTVADLAGDANSISTPGLPLDKGKYYYWRVDSNCGEYGILEGDVWSFKTKYPFQICDDFETQHDYLPGVEGTIWDGIEGNEYIVFLNADDANTGRLYIETGGGVWDGDDIAFLMYKSIPVMFNASVQLYDYQGLYTGTYVDNHWTGLMARISDVDAAGDGEDWVALEVFMPNWGYGLRIRDTNDGETTYWLPMGGGFNHEKYFSMQREGPSLNILKSFDGTTWSTCPGAAPYIRSDFEEGLALQIGICQSLAGTSWSVYDDFCISRDEIFKAYGPRPASGTGLDFMRSVLSWLPGDYADEQHLYFGTDPNAVRDADTGDDEYRGKGNVEGPTDGRYSYDVGELEELIIGQSYYWRVDQVSTTEPNIWPGDVWRFTVQDYSLVDTFESYDGTGWNGYHSPPTGSLKKIWVDGDHEAYAPSEAGTSGSFVQLDTDTHDGDSDFEHYQPGDFAQSGSKSMKFYYDNDGDVCWESYLRYLLYGGEFCFEPDPDKYLSEAYAAIHDDAADLGLDSLDMKKDWSGYKVLKLSFYGDPNSDAEPMYIGLEDEDDTLFAVQYDGDLNDLKEPWWHDWYIALSEFEDGGVDLSKVVRVYIGFGDKDSPASGGMGLVFFDDIELYATPQCIPGSVIGDFDGDCMIDNADLAIFTYNFPGETPTLPTPIIELDADNLSEDPGESVESWYNTGSMHGTFTDVNEDDANEPVVEEIFGKKCVTFDTNDMLIWDQNAPATLTRDLSEPNDYTVIYEVYNPEIADQEFLLTWSRRFSDTGIDYERRHAGFGYGTNASYGAICHWDTPGDMGFDLGVPVARQWHVIAATYVYKGDPNMNAVVVDGLVHGLEEKDLMVVSDDPVTIGAGYLISDDPNENWMEGPGLQKYAPVYDYRYTGSIASIRVYGEAIPPGDLAIVTAAMAGLPKAVVDVKPDSKIDFGDLAVLGNNWMQEPELFGDE